MPRSFSCDFMSSLIFFYCATTFASWLFSSSRTNRINSFFSAFNWTCLCLFYFCCSINSVLRSLLAVLISALRFTSVSFSLASLRSKLSRASLRLKFFSSFNLRAFSRAYSSMAYRSALSKMSSIVPSTKTLIYSIKPVFIINVPILRNVSASFVRFGYWISAEFDSQPRTVYSTMASRLCFLFNF